MIIVLHTYTRILWHFLLLSNQEDTMEESGWKNVHGDVFRPPQYPMILSSLLGSGIQLFCMVLIVICKFLYTSVSEIAMAGHAIVSNCLSVWYSSNTLQNYLQGFKDEPIRFLWSDVKHHCFRKIIVHIKFVDIICYTFFEGVFSCWKNLHWTKSSVLLSPNQKVLIQ